MKGVLSLDEFVQKSSAENAASLPTNLGFFREGAQAENVFVFVAHFIFEGDKENVRLGNDADVANLRDTFQANRGCRFCEWPSPRKNELLQLLSDEQKLLLSFNSKDVPSVFMIFVLSHGSRDGVIYTDHTNDEGAGYEQFTTFQVIEAMKKLPAFEKSLKLVFFAPCRGEITDVIHSDDQRSQFKNNQHASRILNFPNQENFVLVYSTVETTRAIRNEKLGSMLVQNTCATFDILGKDTPLEVVLNKIQNKVHLAIDTAGQSPEVKFVPHRKFIVNKVDASVVARNKIVTDAKGKMNIDLYGVDRDHFFPWLSHKHAEPVRARWAALFSDTRDQHLSNLEKVLKEQLDFETLVLPNSTADLEWLYQKAFGEQSDVGCILLCFIAKIDVDEGGEIVISVGGRRVPAGQIIHHFIGPDNEKWIGRPKIFFFVNSTTGSDLIFKRDKFNLRATNHSGWFAAVLPNKDSIEDILEIMQNPELKNGSSLQELAIQLLSREHEPSQMKPQIATTLPHLLDFPDWPKRYIKPSFRVTVKNVTTATKGGTATFWDEFIPNFISVQNTNIRNSQPEVEISKKDMSFDELKNELIQKNDNYKVYLISSLPGTGKTTLIHELVYWASKCDGEHSIARINLLEQIEYFEESRKVDVFAFLASALQSVWIKNVTQEVVDGGTISIFLDGFDEICPYYRKEGLNLIKEIARLKIPLLITTRPQEEEKIMSALEQVSTTKVEIKPLEWVEQVMLLKLTLRKSDEECIQILEDFKQHGAADILKNPFHLTLIAEHILPANANLFAIYRHVVEKKVRQAMVQKESYDEKSKMFNGKVKRRMKLIQKVAVDFLKSLKIKKMSEDEVSEVNNTGLLTILPNKNVRFVHQTFAEFLAAQFYITELESGDLREDTFFSNESFKQCRAFIDVQLGEADDGLKEGTTAFIRKHLNESLLETIITEKLVTIFKMAQPYFTFLQSEKEDKVLIQNELAALQAACTSSEEIGLILLGMVSSNLCEDASGKFTTLVEDIAKNNFIDLYKALKEKFSQNMAAIRSQKNLAANFASESGHLKMLQMLIENGVSVNLKDRTYRNPLHSACYEGYEECVRTLVENGANLEERNDKGFTALLLAVAANHENIVEFLLEKGADPNAKNDRKNTALHLATINRNTSTVKILLHKEPTLVNAKNESNQTALHLASDVNICELLKVNGADVLSTDYELQNALHSACITGNEEVVQYLLGLGIFQVDAHNINGSSALHLAAKKGNLKICEKLLENGADITFKDANYWNAIHWAAVHSDLQTVRFFNQRDPSLARQKTRQNATVLHLGAVNRNPEVLRFFLESGDTNSLISDLNEQTDEGLTVLMYAAAQGHLSVVRFLCRNGADVRLKDQNMSTALHWAVKMGNPEAARFLLSVEPKLVLDKKFHGENVYHCLKSDANFAEDWQFLFDASIENVVCAVDNAGWSVFHETASRGSPSNLRFLLDLDIFTVDARTADNRTPLHLAVSRHDDVEACHLLIENGADATLVNDEGANALHFACDGGNLDALEILVKIGSVSLNEKRTGDGQTVLHIAAEKNNLQIAKYLLDVGVAVDERNKTGSTALHVAAKFASVEMCRLLLNSGADLNAEMNNEVNALMVACNGKNWEVVEFFLQTGSFDLEKKSMDGRTALHFAAASGDIRSAKLLLEKGADINARDYWNRTPWKLAEFYDSTAVAKFLEANGALVENESEEDTGDDDTENEIDD